MKNTRSRLTFFYSVAILSLAFFSSCQPVFARSANVIPSPSVLQFGNVPVGSQSSLTETISNNGQFNITATAIVIDGAGVSTSGISTPFTLNSGQSVTFKVNFSPTQRGSVAGSVSFISSLGTLVVPVNADGTAQGQLSVSPASLDFGNVAVGSSATRQAQLTATGAPVTVTAASVNNAEFSASGLTFPFTLQPGQSQSISVTFAPQSTGTAAAVLAFNDAPNSPADETLSGTGQLSTPSSVSLSWNASDSPVIGYNVFRGPTSQGPFTQLNASPNPNTAFTDKSISSGQTYYYTTTAVNSSGEQSIYSNIAEVAVP